MKNMINLAPIALFVYNRREHTERTIEALKSNMLAENSDLIIFSDAPKSDKQTDSVQTVRKYLKEIDGFNSVNIIIRETNLGLARSIISGVTYVVNKFGRIIVLEDDMLTSPYFLTYMNEALEKYAEDHRVVSIHGYVYPLGVSLPETFLLPGADCWGWATWRHGWAEFNSDGNYLLEELKERNLIQKFDFNGAYPYSKMLEEQVKGANDSWAVRWYASAFLHGKLTLYPGRSLVDNIGNDNSGTHSRETKGFDVILSTTKICLNNIRIETSEAGRQAFEDFFRRKKMGLLERLLRKTSALLRALGK